MPGLAGEMGRVNARHGVIGYKLYNYPHGGLPQGAAQAQGGYRTVTSPGVNANNAIWCVRVVHCPDHGAESGL